jgi:hypothetical protein
MQASTAAISAGLIATLPSSLLIALRSFVLQQVPLKTTPDLSAAFALGLTIVVLLSGGLGLVAAIRVLGADSRQR